MPKTITIHRPGEFTGDVAHLTGRPSVVSAVARVDCEVYEVSAEGVREVLNRCPDLATSSFKRSLPGASSCASRGISPACA